ncbi:hypothetical protein K432DRAFT_324605 [Lepidopterella palustris CBS 459.81]|uniref:RGS domain-containing protein n=1 Tax=Lepidopterella palustris CBS 459.81 TaxID=1314670 RepID=A0A8E2JHJ6_9PEZI|nr:hypothetical protein K432DRAFT_324605 [Lepidopterella palustris CBS 459.81]
MSILFYRRPDYISRPPGPLNASACQRYAEKSTRNKSQIPQELSFDNIVANRALPPCGLQDFMDYLVYVSHDAENLQFFLWYEGYKRRFAALSKQEQAMSPERSDALAIPEGDATAAVDASKRPDAAAEEIDIGNEADIQLAERARSPFKSVFDSRTSLQMSDNRTGDALPAVKKPATPSMTSAELLQVAHQPFRAEIHKVLLNYIYPSSPRELNLSHRDRSALLHALSFTTHPSAFTPIATLVTATLRNQAHPNFIRWTICNGNQPRVVFVRTMGILNTFLGLLTLLLITLSKASRWWRILGAMELWLGLMTLIAAFKGLCMILHYNHGRVLQPWEDFDIEPESDPNNSNPGSYNMKPKDGDETTLASSFWSQRSSRLDAFGIGNAFDKERWLLQWRQTGTLKKVFGKAVWVQEEGIRLLQDRIVKQSQAWAVLVTIIVTAAFVALPKGGFY